MAGINTKRLTARQQKALVALLASASATDAAKVAGVAERTMSRYLQDATFVACLRRARHFQVEQAVATMQAAATKAVAVLITIATDAQSKASARVTAARSIVDGAIKAVELESIEDRLAKLEQRVKGGAA